MIAIVEGVVVQPLSICAEVDQLDARGVVTLAELQEQLLIVGDIAGDRQARLRGGAVEGVRACLLYAITDGRHGVAWTELQFTWEGIGRQAR